MAFGDADPADQQRGEADDDQEAAEDIEEARQVGGGVLGRADLPAGLREGGADPRRGGVEAGVGSSSIL